MGVAQVVGRQLRAVLAHVGLGRRDRLRRCVGLRRQGEVRGRLGEVERALREPDAIDRLRGSGRNQQRRGSALPMSSEARITMRRAMKRGSSPPSSIVAR